MIWTYFNRDEFMCHCGCGRNKTEDTLLDFLDEARDYSALPYRINSGYRCPTQNLVVGGSQTSSHLKGMAADIACPNSRDRYLIINGLLFCGISRIGIAPTFIHVDMDGTKDSEVIWLY